MVMESEEEVSEGVSGLWPMVAWWWVACWVAGWLSSVTGEWWLWWCLLRWGTVPALNGLPLCVGGECVWGLWTLPAVMMVAGC